MKIAVGMSGGVDSAVAALMLKNAGHDVVGLTLRLKPGNEADAEIRDAEIISDYLGIKLEIIDSRDYFREKIIGNFSEEYRNGRTPNPCIICNELIKFGVMLDAASELGCDKLATGHYADITEENGVFSLRKVLSSKDQSYFLYRLSQSQLSRIIFPIRDMAKADTRAIAAEAGIPVAEKKDSLEVCFIPDNDYVSFLRKEGISAPPGDFIGVDGKKLGTHTGIINYTVGQRKGLGAFGKPMFVTKIDAGNNTVTIGENGTQYSRGLEADSVSFISGNSPSEPFRANVKIRFRAPEQPALIIPGKNGFTVEFDEPQRSVTPGQGAVIYDGDKVIGGGRIIKQID